MLNFAFKVSFIDVILNDYMVSGMVLMMSESPGSVMERVHTLKYLPQAVPSSLLLPV